MLTDKLRDLATRIHAAVNDPDQPSLRFHWTDVVTLGDAVRELETDDARISRLAAALSTALDQAISEIRVHPPQEGASPPTSGATEDEPSWSTTPEHGPRYGLSKLN